VRAVVRRFVFLDDLCALASNFIPSERKIATSDYRPTPAAPPRLQRSQQPQELLKPENETAYS
jgi:hypothetical protein